MRKPPWSHNIFWINQVLPVCLETSHIRKTSKAEEKRSSSCLHVVEERFNLFLHLRTHYMKRLTCFIVREGVTPAKKQNTTESEKTTTIIIKRHPLPPHLEPHVLNWSHLHFMTWFIAKCYYSNMLTYSVYKNVLFTQTPHNASDTAYISWFWSLLTKTCSTAATVVRLHTWIKG